MHYSMEVVLKCISLHLFEIIPIIYTEISAVQSEIKWILWLCIMQVVSIMMAQTHVSL